MLQLFPLLHCFLLHGFTYGQPTGCTVLSWYYLTVMWKLIQDPDINCGKSFLICYWNLNSVSAYNYIKLFSLKVFTAVHKFDIICLSQTYLDFSIVEISGYSLVKSDHPSNNKRGGVCVCYKKILPFRALDIQYLHEHISFELKIGDFVALYR